MSSENDDTVTLLLEEEEDQELLEDMSSSSSVEMDQKCEGTTIKFKRFLKDVEMPQRMTPLSAGLDVYYPHRNKLWIGAGEITAPINLGFGIKMESDTYAQLVSRSSLACKRGIEVVGQPTIIDADYVGPIFVYLRNTSFLPQSITYGERILQMVVCKRLDVKFEECENLPTTQRGSGGFGSTGTHTKQQQPEEGGASFDYPGVSPHHYSSPPRRGEGWRRSWRNQRRRNYPSNRGRGMTPCVSWEDY